jgi:hypothetical protein
MEIEKYGGMAEPGYGQAVIRPLGGIRVLRFS